MINISELYKASNATREFLEFSLSEEDLEQVSLKDPMNLKITLVRVEEGIMLSFDEIAASIKTKCVRCGTDLVLNLKLSGSEWLYFDKRPKDYDDMNEFLTLDMNKMTLNPVSSVRQELMLNMKESPRCKEDCAQFSEAIEGRKSLAGLKDLWEEGA